jgi:hypothetical protein
VPGLTTPAAPVARLDALARGLAKETRRVREDTVNDVLLSRERWASPGSIQDALAGVEEARVRNKTSGERASRKTFRKWELGNPCLRLMLEWNCDQRVREKITPPTRLV